MTHLMVIVCYKLLQLSRYNKDTWHMAWKNQSLQIVYLNIVGLRLHKTNQSP